MTQQISLTTPDDWHLHLRDGAAMADVVTHTAAVFGRAIIMPNLKTPVTTTRLATGYRQRILAALPEGCDFEPMMTLYLTDNTTPRDIHEAAASGFVKAVKLYPAGATTNSSSGVTRLEAIRPALEALAESGMPLLVHGEVTRPDVDIFDREAIFIDEVLTPLIRQYPSLKIVLEHITTRDAVDFVKAGGSCVGATITAHHLLHDRNDMLVGGIRPHLYCLPVLKRNHHRQALIAAATSGNPKFFLGTDSAPHAVGDKESACGCAGCYTAPTALPLYAQIFEQAGALDRLEAFASFHGADFYNLPRNQGHITLVRMPWTVPDEYPFADERIVPLQAGQSLDWQISGRKPVSPDDDTRAYDHSLQNRNSH